MRTRRSLFAVAIQLALLLGASLVNAVPVKAAAPFTLVSEATYRINPDTRTASVGVTLTFRNTTPDPAGSRSEYRTVPLALQPGASAVKARDSAGVLKVTVARRSTSSLASIALRAPLRYGQTARLSVSYLLTDSASPQLRIRPSAVVLPIWSFGTSGSVSVHLPSGLDVRVEGSSLTPGVSGGETALTSGSISRPSAWHALLTAAGGVEYTAAVRNMALPGGMLELRVRAWRDDPDWSTRTLDLATRALPALQRQIGLPYPGGPLVLTESLPAGIGTLAEPVTGAQEVAVAFDAAPFTLLHQLTHIWIGSSLADARWIREGLASHEAAVVAAELRIGVPYEPAAEAKVRAAAALPLDSWGAERRGPGSAEQRTDPQADAWAYAASWAQVDRLATALGEDGLRLVLRRAAAGTSPYDPGTPDAGSAAAATAKPLDSRSFLDQLETVSGRPVSPDFEQAVFGAEQASILEDRTKSRAAYQSLVGRANGWGAPEPIVEALTDWRFEDAQTELQRADQWLKAFQAVQADARAVGLSLPGRLASRWRSDGGGDQASAELDAERALVVAYAHARARIGSLNPIEWLGVLGGPQPREQLATGAGLFAAGDLTAALDAIERATSLDTGAQAGGVVRLAVGAAALAVVGAGIAISLYRLRRQFLRRTQARAS